MERETVIFFGILSLWPAFWAALGASISYSKSPQGLLIAKFSTVGATVSSLVLALVPFLYAVYLCWSRPPGPPERDANPVGFASVVLVLFVLAAILALAAPMCGALAGWLAQWTHDRWGTPYGVIGAAVGGGLALVLTVLSVILRRTGGKFFRSS